MKVNKWFMLAVLLALMALAVTACGGAAAPTSAPPTSAPGATTAPQGGALTCADKIGCVTVKAGEPIHIAWMQVVSGENGDLGIDVRNGAQIALDDLGNKILDHPVKFDGQDSGCAAEGGQAAATRLAADNTIVAVVGSTCSSEWTAGGPTLCNAGFVAVSASATSPVLTDPKERAKWPCFYRVPQNDKVQGAVAAKFVLEQLKLKTIATIHDGTPYTEALATLMGENFEKGGGKVTNRESVDPKATDMKPVLTKIAANKPDLIYYPVFTAAGGFITVQAKEVSGLEKAVLMTADGSFGPSFYKAAGKAAVGTYHSSPDFTAFPGGYPQFVEKYNKKFNTKAPLSTYHAFGYDAILVIADAINRAAQKGSDGTLLIGRQALRDAMTATKGVKGITGTLSCDANGDCADPHIAVYQDTDANVTGLVAPSAPIWKP